MSNAMSNIRSTLLSIWPDYEPTPLIDCPALADLAGVDRVLIKNEGCRPLGNFKALGGMIAGLKAIARSVGADFGAFLANPDAFGALPALVCASDGNHGLAVAAAARRANAQAIIYLPAEVSSVRAARIERAGGQVVRIDGTYDDAVDAARRAAARGQGVLVADTTDVLDDPVVRDVMAGYRAISEEALAQLEQTRVGRPTHLFIQAGVGGLAAAMADGFAGPPSPSPRLLVVEPRAAACVARALAEGRPQKVEGGLTTQAEMLSCGLASTPALATLQRHGAQALQVDEAELLDAVDILRSTTGLQTTPSGVAGLAGLLANSSIQKRRFKIDLDRKSRILLVVTEGRADG
ncbi:pyridoxal-phosphate dependent enzyme [Brevundimonas naejangsanensis]|uniref:pyridoxal-phosphate dependent enzyme n=1 Tax=Brevundimonas naejangsanensis TaxID=588932 RepID=UPI000462B57B|nr:pyridoxal-phosphate dependent enzyme [Brevundimonas naejangsanensis]